jgi:hypothetical protein
MWTRLMPPGRADTLVLAQVLRRPALWGASSLSGTCFAASASPEPALSGPWLLGALALALAVVGALAAALGYTWGRRVGTSTVAPPPLAPGASAPDALPSPPVEAKPEVAPEAAPPASDEGLSFSYTVSHDLRAPVRVVDGFARILKEDYSRQLDRIGNDHLDRILSAASRMNAMIDAMLSLAQLSSQPLARQPVNLSQLAAYILEDLRRGQPDRTVAVEIEPDLQVTGDPTLLRLVLENLLSNAWKYTGKTVSPSIELRASQEQGQRVFEVRDNGAGFDMRSSDRLFGLFQRLHSANDFPGTGVGLASVQRIVRRHGGDIWAQSTPGQGARFCFTIKT